MGGVWPSTVALYIASFLTWKKCEPNTLLQASQNSTLNSTILSMIEANTCGSDIDLKVTFNIIFITILKTFS